MYYEFMTKLNMKPYIKRCGVFVVVVVVVHLFLPPSSKTILSDIVQSRGACSSVTARSLTGGLLCQRLAPHWSVSCFCLPGIQSTHGLGLQFVLPFPGSLSLPGCFY